MFTAPLQKKFCFSLPVKTDALIYLLHFLEMDRSKQAAAGVQHSKTKVVSFPGHSQAQRLLHRLHLRGQPTAAKDHTATTAR